MRSSDGVGMASMSGGLVGQGEDATRGSRAAMFAVGGVDAAVEVVGLALKAVFVSAPWVEMLR